MSNSTAGTVRVEANLPKTSVACAIFYSKCITRTCLTLKIKIKVTEYNIYNSPIRWKISTSIKVILIIFASSRRFQNIHISKLVTLKMYVKVMMYNIRSRAIRWQIPYLLSDVNSNVCIFKLLFEMVNHENLGEDD